MFYKKRKIFDLKKNFLLLYEKSKNDMQHCVGEFKPKKVHEKLMKCNKRTFIAKFKQLVPIF